MNERELMSQIELPRSVEWGWAAENAEQNLVLVQEGLDRRYANISPTNGVFGGIGGSHLSLSTYLWILDRKAEAVENYRIGAWYERWWFRLKLMGSDETVELPLIGTGRTVVMQGRETGYPIDAWFAALFMSANVDDVPLQEMALACRDFSERKRPSEWKLARAELFRSFIGGFDDVGDRLLYARGILSAAAVGGPEPFGGTWKDGFFVQYRLIQAILDASQSAFDAAIETAHDHHVRVYSSINSDGLPRNTSTKTVLDRRTAMIIRKGVESGLALNRKSPFFEDYSPWLREAEPIAPEYEPA